MLLFALNLLITFAWVGLSQDFSPQNLVIGFASGCIFLAIVSWNLDDKKYFKKLPSLFVFACFYFYELLRSNIEVAWDVLTPSDLSSPAIVRIPLEIQSDFQISILMNLITFTPGSLSVDLSPDKKYLYVHGMFVHDRDEFIREIKEGFEKRIIDLFE